MAARGRFEEAAGESPVQQDGERSIQDESRLNPGRFR
jgi:hypothetical protein